MGRTVTLAADFDITDAFDEATDEELAAEMASRGKAVPAKEAALQAINQIRRGDYADAITTLEREFLPKWASVADCNGALATHFAKAVAVQVAAHVG